MLKDCSTKIIKNLFSSLSPIQALSNALPAINTLISTCIIGNTLGQSALAAIGFANPFSYIVLFFANMCGVGSQILCSKHIGEGNHEKINRAFNTTMVLCSAFGILLCVITLLFSGLVSKLMGTSSELLQQTADYLKGYSFCCLFTILLGSLIPFLQLDCAKAITTICVVTQIVLNIGLNILNSFYLHLGMFGVGLSASIAAFVACIIAVIYILCKSKLFRFSLNLFSKSECKEVLSFGSNAALRNVWLFSRERIYNAIAFAMGGELILSAFTVANNIGMSLALALEGGVSGTGNTIAGVLVGERDVKSLRQLPGVMCKSIYPFSFFCYGLIFFLAKPVILLFGVDMANIGTYVLVARILNLWILTNPIKSSVLSVYSALKRIKLLGLYNFLNLFLFPVSCLLFAKILSSEVLLFSYAWIPDVLLEITFVIYYVIKSKSFKELKFVYVPRDFSVPKKDIISISVKSFKDVSNASDKVIQFCKEKGINDKTSMYCGLCLEELTADTITNGFNKKKGKDSIDIRIIYEAGHISMLIRDCCPHFDPKQWLELYAQDDPSRSIGLKMVSKLSQEMTYSSNLGLNIVTVRI